MHMRVFEFLLHQKYEIHGGTPANFVVLNFGATAYFSCTLPDFRHPKRYKIQGGTPAIFCLSFGVRPSIHTLPKFHPNSCVFRMIFGVFWGGPPIRNNFLRSKVAGGRPRRLRDDFVMIFGGFWPFGEPRGTLWG